MNDHDACVRDSWGPARGISCDFGTLPAGESVSLDWKLRATGKNPAEAQVVEVRVAGLGQREFGVAATTVKIVE